MTRSIGARDVLGVPLVPPANASTMVNRLRAGVLRACDALAPPPVRVMDAALSWLDLVAARALCGAGVPDALDRPMAVEDLARRLHADRDSLARLLSFAAARNWVRVDRRGRVRPTRVLRFMSTTHPGGWRAWIEFAALPEVRSAGGALGDAVVDGTDAFAAANGASFFTWMADHPASSTAFDAAMAAGGRLHGLAIARALDWSGVRTVCDVGGGNGALLRMLTELHPHLSGTVLDLPHVVGGRQATARVDYLAGDVFDRVPGDFDVYLLVNVIHDWSDMDAVRILTSVATAAPPASRVVIVDSERRRRPIDDLSARADLLMLALAPGGRERSRGELDELARSAGLHPAQAVPLASADVARVYTRSAT